MMSKKKISSPFVYSTNPEFIVEQNKEEDVVTLSPPYQKLQISLDKKQRAGKIVTLVTGFKGKEEDLLSLSKQLKSFCGTGGAVKDDMIIIQGDNKQKIFQWLKKNGYSEARETR